MVVVISVYLDNFTKWFAGEVILLSWVVDAVSSIANKVPSIVISLEITREVKMAFVLAICVVGMLFYFLAFNNYL